MMNSTFCVCGKLEYWRDDPYFKIRRVDKLFYIEISDQTEVELRYCFSCGGVSEVDLTLSAATIFCNCAQAKLYSEVPTSRLIINDKKQAYLSLYKDETGELKLEIRFCSWCGKRFCPFDHAENEWVQV